MPHFTHSRLRDNAKREPLLTVAEIASRLGYEAGSLRAMLSQHRKSAPSVITRTSVCYGGYKGLYRTSDFLTWIRANSLDTARFSS